MRKLRKSLAEALVDRGAAETMAAAKAFIMAGQVVVNDQRIDKPGFEVRDSDQIRIKTKERYVGRGGMKLEGALQDLSWVEWIRDKVVLDVGASTGGFTDCCLQHGAAQVVAVDVGTNQLAWRLRQDSRVVSYEKTDIRGFVLEAGARPDLLVADLSFISLSSVAADLRRLGIPRNLILMKPQFEVEKQKLPQGGVIEDARLWQLATARAAEVLEQSGFNVAQVLPARVTGRQGNQEFFMVCTPSPAIQK